MIVLSHYQARPLLEARRQSAVAFPVSLDLNLSQSEAALDAEGVVFPDGQRLEWAAIEEIAEHDTACFLVENNGIERVQFYSPDLRRTYSLYPTERAPTMLLAGYPMHRIKEIDPVEDTKRKMAAIAPVGGQVLDTTTGLGYATIAASKTAASVTTIELDPTVIELCHRNPWSQALFDNPRITQKIGSAFEIVPTLPDTTYSRIVHDPPTFKLAGDLYSEAFYRELRRVLARGGKLFHYVGDLNSPSGSSVAKGVVRRLQSAGFTKVVRAPEAFAVVAS